MKYVKVGVKDNPKTPAKPKPAPKKEPAKMASNKPSAPRFTDGPLKGMFVPKDAGGGSQGRFKGKKHVAFSSLNSSEQAKVKKIAAAMGKPASKSNPNPKPASKSNPKPSNTQLAITPKWTSGPNKGRFIPKSQGGGLDGWRMKAGKGYWGINAKKPGAQSKNNPEATTRSAYTWTNVSGSLKLVFLIILGWTTQRFTREVSTWVADLVGFNPKAQGEHLIIRNLFGLALTALLYPWAWREKRESSIQDEKRAEWRQTFFLGNAAGAVYGLLEDVVRMAIPSRGTTSDAARIAQAIVRTSQSPGPFNPVITLRGGGSTATSGIIDSGSQARWQHPEEANYYDAQGVLLPRGTEYDPSAGVYIPRLTSYDASRGILIARENMYNSSGGIMIPKGAEYNASNSNGVMLPKEWDAASGILLPTEAAGKASAMERGISDAERIVRDNYGTGKVTTFIEEYARGAASADDISDALSDEIFSEFESAMENESSGSALDDALAALGLVWENNAAGNGNDTSGLVFRTGDGQLRNANSPALNASVRRTMSQFTNGYAGIARY